MSTWLNEELPDEWPSAKGTQRVPGDISNEVHAAVSLGSNIGETVAIVPSPAKTPQWKMAMSPRRSQQGNVDHLVGLFHNDDSSTSHGQGNASKSGHFAGHETSSSSSESQMSGLDRRLKVFGQPDTFTNQKLDGFLASLQGRQNDVDSKEGSTRRSFGGDETTADVDFGDISSSEAFVPHEIDVQEVPKRDVASHYMHVGEDLLKRIRKTSMMDLKARTAVAHHEQAQEETSLDDLERKLSQPHSTLNSTINTTLSSANGSTLSSVRSQSFAGPFGAPARFTHAHNPSIATTASAPQLGDSDRYHDRYDRDCERERSDTMTSGSWSSTTIHGRARSQDRLPKPRPSSGARNPRVSVAVSPGLSSVPSLDFNFQHRPAHAAPPAQDQSMASVDRDVNSLAIAGDSFGESSVESHNLETRPSIVVMRSRPSASVLDGTINSINTVNTTGSADEAPDRDLSWDPVPPTPASQAAPAARAARFRSEPGFRDTTAADAFEVSLRLGNDTLKLPPLPGNLSTSSIGRKNTTFSGTMLELVHLLGEFRDLDKLRELDFSSKGIECVKGLDALVPNVGTLNLAHNDIRVLEGIPRSVTAVDLSHNALDRISTFPVAFITRLDVSHNHLSDLRGLSQLRALSNLSVTHNKLTSLRGIDALPALQELDASHNELEELAVAHRALKKLRADSNKIRACRLDTPQLAELRLDNNQVVTLAAVPSVRVLAVRNNWASVDFAGWTALDELYYDGNDSCRNLDRVAPRIVSWQGTEMTGFDGRVLRRAHTAVLAGPGLDISSLVATLAPLQQLDLLNAGVSRLPAWLPSRVPALVHLNMSFNQLDDAALAVISEFSGLRKLSLYQNNIASAPAVASALAKLTHIGAVDLRMNPVTAGMYPNVSLQDDQPPESVYRDLLEMDWPALDDQWLRKAPADVAQRRETYLQTLGGLPVWWLDGREQAVPKERRAPSAEPEPEAEPEAVPEPAEEEHKQKQKSQPRVDSAEPANRFVNHTVLSPAQLSAFGISTPQQTGRASQATPSRQPKRTEPLAVHPVRHGLRDVSNLPLRTPRPTQKAQPAEPGKPDEALKTLEKSLANVALGAPGSRELLADVLLYMCNAERQRKPRSAPAASSAARSAAKPARTVNSMI